MIVEVLWFTSSLTRTAYVQLKDLLQVMWQMFTAPGEKADTNMHMCC